LAKKKDLLGDCREILLFPSVPVLGGHPPFLELQLCVVERFLLYKDEVMDTADEHRRGSINAGFGSAP
jgi:hypothetical protein